ncbi:MAG TPA: ankyrin repeat domain-containing protein [Chthonomonadaceae bacterium]|nr:ankyrin repeat domain-containing protein [Chthonomonadaceae bacterium]
MNQSMKRYCLFLLVLLLFTTLRPGLAQPGPPPQTENERKAQLLTAEMFIAIRNNDAAEVNRLIANGTDPNNRNWLGFTSLMWAGLFGNSQIVDSLLAHHAQIEAPSIYGTALSFALVGRREATALHLLDKGASIHTGRADAATPLMLAAGNGEMAVLKRLLAKRDNPNAQDADGATPLIYAARNDQAAAVQALLQAGARINGTDSHGRTALMYAAENGHTESVHALLAMMAQVNLRDKEGATALTLASRHNGSADVISTLLQHGADTGLKDGHGAMALQLAEMRGYRDAALALRKPGDAGSQAANAVLTSEQTGPAVERSLTAVQTAMKTFASRVQCISCHHQGLGMMALGTAQQHGYTVDRALVGSYLQHMGEDAQKSGPFVHMALHDANVAKTIPAVDMGDFPIGGGYIVNGLIAQGVPTNPGLQEMAQFLCMQQAPDGHWGYGMERGPMQSSYLTTTALVLRILRAYGPAEGEAQSADCYARAKKWLLTTPTPNMEDKSSRLFGLKLAGANTEERAKPLQELLAAQRPDGGWAQVASSGSDAYATGMALYALHVGGELSTNDPAYQRGVQYLLRTQDEDGSWYVKKRVNPANIFIDAGFPHGESQYISFAATCWATMALVQGKEEVQRASR